MEIKICTKCNIEKGINEFYFKTNRDNYVSYCKECARNFRKLYYCKNREAEIKRSLEYNKKVDPQKLKITARKTYYKNKDKYNYKMKIYRENNREVIREQQRNKRIANKLTVFYYYGLKCSCCGENDYKCLTIDHINGGGHEHLRKIGNNFYGWLIKNEFPKEFQTLCITCNKLKYRNNNKLPEWKINKYVK